MARFVRNKYSFSLSDDKAARLTIQNLKRYATKLGKEKAKTYAERMVFEGEKHANELLGQKKPRETLYYRAPRAIKENGKYDDRSRFSGSKPVDLDVAVAADAFARNEKGRTRVFVRLVGSDATFYEFGTGVALNQNEHPYKEESGLSPLGTYGAGHGADKTGWYLPREVSAGYGITANGRDVTLLRTKGIKQARVLFETAQHLKTLSPSIAKQAFKGL